MYEFVLGLSLCPHLAFTISLEVAAQFWRKSRVWGEKSKSKIRDFLNQKKWGENSIFSFIENSTKFGLAPPEFVIYCIIVFLQHFFCFDWAPSVSCKYWKRFFFHFQTREPYSTKNCCHKKRLRSDFWNSIEYVSMWYDFVFQIISTQSIQVAPFLFVQKIVGCISNSLILVQIFQELIFI